jgi:ATP synthase protein I
MSEEPPSSRPSLADLEARLAKARRSDESRRVASGEGQSAMGVAFRLSAELVSAVVVGAGIGWLLDRWLGTGPWLLLGFFLLGAIAGILGVTRTARDMNARAMRQMQEQGTPPSVPDDEDE